MSPHISMNYIFLNTPGTDITSVLVTDFTFEQDLQAQVQTSSRRRRDTGGFTYTVIDPANVSLFIQLEHISS